jgi:hypothetical protein
LSHFGIHPSAELVSLFKNKPFQGQHPEKAKIIFVSSDANYNEEISTHKFFNLVLEYQSDGVAFWKKYKVHHPFLHPDFPFKKNTGGRPFHNTFSRLGLDATYAEYISFVELLDVPTIGNKGSNRLTFKSLLNKHHLEKLDSLFNSNAKQLFFISNGVLKELQLINKSENLFSALKKSQNQPIVKQMGSNLIEEVYCFLSSHINRQLRNIRLKIDLWLNQN